MLSVVHHFIGFNNPCKIRYEQILLVPCRPFPPPPPLHLSFLTSTPAHLSHILPSFLLALILPCAVIAQSLHNSQSFSTFVKCAAKINVGEERPNKTLC